MTLYDEYVHYLWKFNVYPDGKYAPAEMFSIRYITKILNDKVINEEQANILYAIVRKVNEIYEREQREHEQLVHKEDK